MFQKNPPKFHDKTVQSNILWLNLNKNQWNNFFFLQSAHKQGNPSFHFHAPAQEADTHAHKQHRLSQNIFPVCSSFVLVIASDTHLESQSEKRMENVDFDTSKSIQIQPTLFFAIFRGIFTVVWPHTTCEQMSTQTLHYTGVHRNTTVCQPTLFRYF